MNPPIDPKPEEVNNDVQGKVIETAREQEQINFVYGPPAVPATPAPEVLYHQEAMTYGPVTARQESPFMGMAMAMQQNAGKQQEQPALQKNEWRCACGTVNGRRFCMNCGKPKPETWTCGCCGAENTGKFCMECGKPQQEEKPPKPALTEREKAAAGYLYDANNDAELIRLRTECAKQIRKFNDTMPDETEQQREILRGLLGKTDGDFVILQPFRCDYGSNISIGKNFFSNYNCIILDAAPVTFGDNVFIAPNCVFSAAGHALDAEQRAAGLEIALPITVGDDVWFGANVTVLPGVTIGSNTVIGAGSVVTKDIPSGVVAAGNPCRVLREITDADKQKYPVCEE